MPLQPPGGDPLLCNRAEKHDLEVRNQVDTFRIITEFFLDDPERSPYTTSVILELHRLTIQGIYPCSGQFRTALTKVKIGGASIAPIHPSQVVNEMNDLLSAARRHSETDHTTAEDVRFAARTFHRFLAIHPFNGGNGRVSRSFLVLMLYQLKVFSPPCQLFDYIEQRRSSYIPALQAADRGNLDQLTNYLFRGVVQAQIAELLAFMERIGVREYVIQRLPRDQRRLCHPRHHAAFSDGQFLRESMRFNRSIRKIVAKIQVSGD